jgi:hypothetical protein
VYDWRFFYAKEKVMEKLKGTGKIPVIKKVDYQALSQLRKTVSKLKGSFKSQNLQQKLQIPLGGYNGKD